MLPEHSPFTPDQRRTLEGLIASLSPAQRFWLGGFLSAGDAAPIQATGGASTSAQKLTVLYGTESGNSEKLADLTAKEAKKRGFQATVKNMADITPADLGSVQNLMVVVSTWGEGDPPETAVPFYKEFMSGELQLTQMKYSVCALGDTAYERFCQIGKDVDARLEQLGAQRIHPRQDCDLEYEQPHRDWMEAAFSAFGPAQSGGGAAATIGGGFDFAMPAAVEYTKANPFQAEVTERVLLNGKGTQKETWHYEFSLDGSGINYQPGDSLGVVPVNAPDMVQGLLHAAKLSGTETVEINGEGKLLADALREDLEITTLTKPVLEKLFALTSVKKLGALLAEGARDQLKDYLWGRWVADALMNFAPKGISARDLVSVLRKLPARLYSIASSPLAHPGEVHLTVAAVRYEAHGQPRKGVTSTYLADLVQTGSHVPVYVNENRNFRLPENPETPVIMVGPGTGVAPFRAFVEHRGAQGAAGKSWLFFGDQRYTYDFLYQVEWQEHLASGALTRLDVAFSRDQPEKVYVQHRMLERSRELYAWLQEGAHLYVCGDASRMAHDVNEALLAVIQKEGGKSLGVAESYLEDLKKSRRYQKDVY